MTTNIDRAAKVIADTLRPALSIADGIGEDLARILATAGVLAPDPPEPDFIKKHPVPWSVAEGYFDEWSSRKADGIGSENQSILDANGSQIIRTHDASGYQSWFAGDIDEFIVFVNEHFANHAEEADHADA